MIHPVIDNEDLAEEVEAINAIYGPSTINPSSTPSSSASTESTTATTTVILQVPNHEHLTFLVSFDNTYPTTPPRIIGTASTSGAARGQGKKAVGILEDVVRRTWTEGSVCLFDVIEEAGEKFGELQAGDEDSEYPTSTTSGPTDPTVASSLDTAVLTSSVSVDLGVPPDWTISDIITEKKSVFIARAVQVDSKEEAERYLDHLLATEKKVASATHNITAWRIRQKKKQGLDGDERKGGKKSSSGGKETASTTSTDTIIQDFDDDGETAAGGRLLHLMQLMDVWDVVVVVTRWFGGVKLGPDRFRLINAAGRDALVKGGFVKKDGPAGNNEKGRKKNKK